MNIINATEDAFLKVKREILECALALPKGISKTEGQSSKVKV